jgi:glycosyltransferase involved in cell wall biosynthesis
MTHKYSNDSFYYHIFNVKRVSFLKQVYISVTNDLVTDQRVHRVASLLEKHQVRVRCFGRRLNDNSLLHGMSCSVRRFRMLFNKGPLFYACFNFRLFLTLLFVSRPSLFIANDLDTLPANYLAARIRGVKLIYDSHEFFTEVPELVHRKRVQSIWKWIEGRILPHLEYAVTVSYPIATIYRRLYGTRFRVVRNVPERKVPPPAGEKAPEFGDRRVILYQGALNVGRGLEGMIETMKCLDRTVLVLAGRGDIEQALKQQVREAGLTEKVVFKGRMNPEELYPLTCSADLGISMEEDRGRNYRYALPNKLFDYIQARIPVLCADLPEMRRIVETHGIGVVVRHREPERLAGTIRFMLKERDEGAWRDALEKAAEALCWENESGEYLLVLRECGLFNR